MRPFHSDRADQKHKENIANYFSKVSQCWRDVYVLNNDKRPSFMTEEMRERKKAVLCFLDEYTSNRSLRVLDIGCGTGIYMKEVLERRHAVVGLDITEEMLSKAKEMLKDYMPGRAVVVCGDVENMDFVDNSFDVILCIGVLQYLQDDNKAIAEISRVLKSGGIAIVTLPNVLRINAVLDPYYYLVRGCKYLILKFRNDVSATGSDFGSNESFINRRYFYWQISGMFDHFFKKVGLTGIAYGPPTFWHKEILPLNASLRINQFISSISHVCGFHWMHVFANRWVICLKKETA